MVASKTLRKQLASIQSERNSYSLLGVISGICADSWVHVSFYSIIAPHDHSIPVCMEEFVVEQVFPNTMHKSSTTMSKDILLLGIPLLVE
jgi:hypothetical protein